MMKWEVCVYVCVWGERERETDEDEDEKDDERAKRWEKREERSEYYKLKKKSFTKKRVFEKWLNNNYFVNKKKG